MPSPSCGASLLPASGDPLDQAVSQDLGDGDAGGGSPHAASSRVAATERFVAAVRPDSVSASAYSASTLRYFTARPRCVLSRLAQHIAHPGRVCSDRFLTVSILRRKYDT